jgi:hypothetical protein
MAKTALSELQERIEAVRREAYAAGFAAAMQTVREFAAQAASNQHIGSSEPRRRGRISRAQQQEAEPGTPRPPRARQRRSPAGRPPRGSNARMVEEILRSNAPRALRPAEIRGAIEREKGVSIAFTSIRHALGQLEARGLVEQVAETNAWRYIGVPATSSE